MNNIYFLTAFTLFLFLSCELPKFTIYRIIINNETNHKIQFFAARPDSEFVYPNTTLPTEKIGSPVILPRQSGYVDSGLKWEKEYAKLPSDKMSIYIFDSDPLKKYDWENVRTNYRVLKRFDLTLQDLQMKNFYVTYK